MQLNDAPESNWALAFVLPTLALYVDICILLICSDSISVGLADSAVGLGYQTCFAVH